MESLGTILELLWNYLELHLEITGSCVGILGNHLEIFRGHIEIYGSHLGVIGYYLGITEAMLESLGAVVEVGYYSHALIAKHNTK